MGLISSAGRLLKPLMMTAFVAAMTISSGCHSNPSPAPPAADQKTFQLRGKIVSVDAVAGSILVDHKAIPGFMDAMTMSYKLANPTIASELHPGDLIVARILAKETPGGPTDVRIDDVDVTAQANPNALPVMQYHVPKPGDEIPDFKLLNQSGKHIELKQFRGKALLVTFIYTRCPLADYCPRMSANFEKIDQALKPDPALYARTHLLSISFDPRYDTPAVLRSYGGAHTGRFTEEDFRHWDFAAPSEAELTKVEEWFDLGVTPARPGDPTILTHSLSTVLIGKDGKVVAWYPTNDWKPVDVLADVKAAASK